MPPPATPTNSQLPSQSELERLRRSLAEILGFQHQLIPLANPS